jgi:hypothetical protein
MFLSSKTFSNNKLRVDMSNIENSFTKLTQAIESGKSLSMNSHGEWRVDGWFMRIVKWIFRLDEKSKINVCKVVSKLFDNMEKRAVFFDADRNTTRHQNAIYKGYLSVAKAAKAVLSQSKSKQAKRSCFELQRRIVGLSYRIEEVNGGSNAVTEDQQEEHLYKELIEKAAQWKKKLKLFMGTDSDLHPVDRKNLKELCQYPEFVTLLLKDPVLQSEILGWTLKNAVSPKSLVEFPSSCKRLKQCLMVGRIGRYAYENVLSIDKTPLLADHEKEAKQKVLSLPFNGKKISVLNEDRYVEFKGNYIVRIKTVFNDMKNKNNAPGHFEFIGKNGFRNWNPHKLAYWDAKAKVWKRVNLNNTQWWKNLPEQEIIGKEDVLRRYGIKSIENNEWLLLGRSTRQSTEYRIDDCHGYGGVLVPEKNGTWRVYDWGKYAKVWPKGFFGGIGILGDTVRADFTYPDCNDTYSGFRQQALIPFVCSEEEGIDYMNNQIKSNIIAGREGNLVFMFGFENCAYSPQTDLEALLGRQGEGGRVPNLFISHVLSADAAEPLGVVFRNVAKAPKILRRPLVTLCEISLLSSRGVYVTNKDGKRVFKSLATSPFRRGYNYPLNEKTKRVYQHIFLPSHLHRRIINKEIEGVIWTGHQHMQIL